MDMFLITEEQKLIYFLYKCGMDFKSIAEFMKISELDAELKYTLAVEKIKEMYHTKSTDDSSLMPLTVKINAGELKFLIGLLTDFKYILEKTTSSPSSLPSEYMFTTNILKKFIHIYRKKCNL